MKLVCSISIALSACGNGAPPAPAAPATTAAETAPAQAPLPAVGPAWTLVLESHYGPCDESDPRPCHTSWTAKPDGAITRLEYPNNGGKPAETRFTLSDGERDRLAALLATRDFSDGMEDGFPCEGKAPEHDASLRLRYKPARGPGRSQYVLRCTYLGDGKNVPGEIVALIRR